MREQCYDFLLLSAQKNLTFCCGVGVTEVAVGVPFPRRAFEVVSHHVSGRGGGRALRHFVFEGRTMPAARAFELGFGDTLDAQPRAAAVTQQSLASLLPFFRLFLFCC